jgi:hypothetical protein
MNMFCRYKVDNENKSQYYKLHVLDEVMENVNMWTKQLSMYPSEEQWVYHSSNVMIARRCMNFEKENYRRNRIDIEKVMTEGSTILELLRYVDHRTVEPRKNRERSRLYELYSTLLS